MKAKYNGYIYHLYLHSDTYDSWHAYRIYIHNVALQMPKFTVSEKSLLQAIDRSDMTMEQFDELCFEFGIELDEWEDVRGEEGKVLRRDYKIEIPANRYDLLCFEGLTRALNVFLGNTEQAHIYK